MSPDVHYVYMLEMEGPEYYIGQTNNLEVRLAEHESGHGAAATKGRPFKAVWFSQVHDREAAKLLEGRLQRLLKADPAAIARIVASFDRVMSAVRPQKTFRELEREQRQHDRLMEMALHKGSLIGMGMYDTACGLRKPLGVGTWEEFRDGIRERQKIAELRKEGFGSIIRYVPPICPECLKLVPAEGE